MAEVAPADEESTEAWSGPHFERFLRFRPYVAEGLGQHGEVAMAMHPPRPGDRVLDLGGPFDYVFSRMGVMFFANPVQALRNVRGAMRPGGRVCFVVWRRKLANGWVHEAERVVERYLEHPEETEEPTCGRLAGDAGQLVGGAQPVAEGADRVQLARVQRAADDPVPHLEPLQ